MTTTMPMRKNCDENNDKQYHEDDHYADCDGDDDGEGDEAKTTVTMTVIVPMKMTKI